MSLDTETLFVECDRDAALTLVEKISALESGRAVVTERRNLDGTALPWAAVFATLAVRALPHVLDFIVELVKTNRVKSIKVGDIDVQNPGPEELRALRLTLKRRTPPGA